MRLAPGLVAAAMLGNMVVGVARLPGPDARADTSSGRPEAGVSRIRRAPRFVRERVRDVPQSGFVAFMLAKPGAEIWGPAEAFTEATGSIPGLPENGAFCAACSAAKASRSADVGPAAYLPGEPLAAILPRAGRAFFFEPDFELCLHLPDPVEIDIRSVPPPRLKAYPVPSFRVGVEHEFRSLSAGFVGAARPRPGPGHIIRAGNVLLSLPQDCCDWGFRVGRLIFPPAGSYSIRIEDDSTILQRAFAFREGPHIEHPFIDALNLWIAKEQKYFAGFAESTIYTYDVEDGARDFDYLPLENDQRRILLDIFRETYMTKYFSKISDSGRNEAYRFAHWYGFDFVVGPPIIVAFTWYRGFERSMGLGRGLKLGMKLEPVQRIMQHRGNHDESMIGALGFELSFGKFPIKALVSFGYHEGDQEMSFIGIGTSIGIANKAVSNLLADDDEPLFANRR